MQRVFSAAAANPLMLPPDFMAYIFDYIQTGRLQVPIGQVFGFTPYANQIQAQEAELQANADAIAAAAIKAYADTSGSLSCPAHTSTSGSGPSLSGLTAGSYIVQAGYDSSGLDAHSMTLSPGGMVVSDNPRAQLLTVTGTTITTTLAGTGSGVNGSIFNCWLMAFRYAN